MKTTHTPGTWYVRSGAASEIEIHSVEDRDGLYPIADIPTDEGLKRKEMEANAKLIAAAPALFDALVGLLECPDLNLDSLEEGTIDAIMTARDAIDCAGGMR